MLTEEVQLSTPAVGKKGIDDAMNVDATEPSFSPLSDGTHSNVEVVDWDRDYVPGYASDSEQAQRIANGMSADPAVCKESEEEEEEFNMPEGAVGAADEEDEEEEEEDQEVVPDLPPRKSLAGGESESSAAESDDDDGVRPLSQSPRAPPKPVTVKKEPAKKRKREDVDKIKDQEEAIETLKKQKLQLKEKFITKYAAANEEKKKWKERAFAAEKMSKGKATLERKLSKSETDREEMSGQSSALKSENKMLRSIVDNIRSTLKPILDKKEHETADMEIPGVVSSLFSEREKIAKALSKARADVQFRKNLEKLMPSSRS